MNVSTVTPKVTTIGNIFSIHCLLFRRCNLGLSANRLIFYRSVFFYTYKGGDFLKSLEEKILREGVVLDGDVLKVGSFLNQQIDTDFLFSMGEEIANYYKEDKITKVLTVEASGIAVAVAAAHYINVPVVFAKKSRTSNVSGEVYSAMVHSYTHGIDNNIAVPKDYLSPSDKVLIVDDFLANGKAFEGLIEIANKAGCEVVGCAVAIEKGYQGGGDALRSKGIRVHSLAVIDKMSPAGIEFRK